MLLPNWFRKFIRNRTKEIPEYRAYLWSKRLSFAYVLLAWNAFGVVVYQVYKGNSDWAKDYKNEVELKMTPAQQWASTLGVKEAKVFRVSGFKVSSYDIKNDNNTSQIKNEDSTK